jgi:hypothetical protein
MATEAAQLECKESTARKEITERENTLDSYRPSHGRTYAEVVIKRLKT